MSEPGGISRPPVCLLQQCNEKLDPTRASGARKRISRNADDNLSATAQSSGTPEGAVAAASSRRRLPASAAGSRRCSPDTEIHSRAAFTPVHSRQKTSIAPAPAPSRMRSRLLSCCNRLGSGVAGAVHQSGGISSAGAFGAAGASISSTSNTSAAGAGSGAASAGSGMAAGALGAAAGSGAPVRFFRSAASLPAGSWVRRRLQRCRHRRVQVRRLRFSTGRLALDAGFSAGTGMFGGGGIVASSSSPGFAAVSSQVRYLVRSAAILPPAWSIRWSPSGKRPSPAPPAPASDNAASPASPSSSPRSAPALPVSTY